MRPRGEIRQALAAAADMLHQQRGAFTGRDVAMHAQAGWEATRRTLQNMVNAGELVVAGTARAPGVSRPLNLYRRPAADERATSDVAAELVQAVRRWADFR